MVNKILFVSLVLLGLISFKYYKIREHYAKESLAKMYFYKENVKLKAELDSAITTTKL